MNTFELVSQINKIQELNPLTIQNKVINTAILKMHSKGIYVPLNFSTTISNDGIHSTSTYFYNEWQDKGFLYDKLLSMPETSAAYGTTLHTIFEYEEKIDYIYFSAKIKIVMELKDDDEALLRDLGIVVDEYQRGYTSTSIACGI